MTILVGENIPCVRDNPIGSLRMLIEMGSVDRYQSQAAKQSKHMWQPSTNGYFVVGL